MSSAVDQDTGAQRIPRSRSCPELGVYEVARCSSWVVGSIYLVAWHPMCESCPSGKSVVLVTHVTASGAFCISLGSEHALTACFLSFAALDSKGSIFIDEYEEDESLFVSKVAQISWTIAWSLLESWLREKWWGL